MIDMDNRHSILSSQVIGKVGLGLIAICMCLTMKYSLLTKIASLYADLIPLLSLSAGRKAHCRCFQFINGVHCAMDTAA